jgi:hypothetical protein
MQENLKNRPLLIIGLAVLLLFILSLLPGNIHVGPFIIKPVDLFMDIKPDSLLGQSIYENSKLKNTNLSPEEASVFNFSLSSQKYTDYESYDAAVTSGFSGNVASLKPFFDALKTAGSNPVRIAHFGDSEIEGDLVSSDIRQMLQEKFGGRGAGFLSVTSQDVSLRNSIKQSFSRDWHTSSIFVGNSGSMFTGVAGTVSRPGANAWVKFETTGRFKNLRTFRKVRIFYSNAKSSSFISCNFDNKKDIKAELNSGSSVKEVVLNADNDAKSFKFSASEGVADFYGVSIENENGVYLDNLSFPGSTGSSLKDLSVSVLKDFNTLLNYKLIILSFGSDIISSKISNYNQYEREMIRAVNFLKTAFPQAGILIMSVGDRGLKKGDSVVSDSNVPALVNTQKKIAEKTGVAFWNLYDAMGGANSASGWYNSKLVMANGDYTHLTMLGANKIAELFNLAVMQEIKKSN